MNYIDKKTEKNPYYSPAQYQFASGLTPKGHIEIHSKRFRFLCWLLKPNTKNTISKTYL